MCINLIIYLILIQTYSDHYNKSFAHLKLTLIKKPDTDRKNKKVPIVPRIIMIKKSEPTTYKAPSYNNLYAYPIKTIEIIKIIKLTSHFYLTFSFCDLHIINQST